MALNFPDNPATNEYFTDNTSGFTYQWNGTVWISVASTQTTSLKEFDDISSSFNGSTTTFSLTFANGSTKVYPLGVNQITIVIGGILQNAGDDFTISGDQITFTTAPDAGLTFQGMFYGSSVSMNSVSAGSITTSSLSTGGPIWNVGGDVTVAGIVTVGSSSVVIDGPSNEIRVGTGATINASGIVIGGSGIVTATAFYGDGSNLEGVISGIGTTGSVNTSGIITASSFTGSGEGLTNIGGQMHAISYSPGIAATGVGATSNIVITFNKPVKANTGTITLKEGAADGSTVESFDVATSDKITISGGQITIDPTSDFSLSTSYYVAVPAGSYKDILNTSSSPGISTYSFETEVDPEFESGLLFVWGRNTSAHLGLNDNANRSLPQQIPGTTWSTFDQGNYLSAATKSDGTLWIWGDNGRGGIGVNDTVKRSSPTQVPGTQWSTTKFQMCAGRVPMAIKTDGTLWVIGGENGTGELGLNDIAHRSSPNQLPGTQWSKVSQSSQESLAIKTDGTLWAWGDNTNGQIGVNDKAHRSSPKQVPGTQWSHCFNGGLNTNAAFATKTDGTLWAWGGGGSGQLGQNNTVDYSSPIRIPGTQWMLDSVAANDNTASALKTDGTLWVWGSNGNGEVSPIGIGVNYSSPHQIPGTQWQSAKMNMIANKTDGTLWAWGYNSFGAMGVNDNTPRSSPVQIPGTWSSIADINRGDYMTGAFQPSS